MRFIPTHGVILALALFTGLQAGAADIVNEPLTSGTIPSGWSQTDVTFGSYANFTSLSADLTSPVIDLTGYTGVTLTFDVAKFGSGGNGPLTVEFSDDGGATWTAQTYDSPTPTSSTYVTSGPTAITVTGATVQFRFIRTASASQKRLKNVLLTGTPGAAGTSVQFVSTTSTATENGGAVNLALAITNAGASATTVTIGAVDPNGRLTSYSTSVTFPGGSSADENVVVTPADNAICDGDEDLTFTITGISGGAGTATIGTNASNTLTLTDDEVCTNTSVQFLSASGTVSEGIGTFNALLSITDFSAVNNTEVTIGLTDPDGRISTFDATVIFPATSGADENMSITVADNSICQLDGDVVFTILSVTGGEGTATIGANSTATLTITDNDPLATPTTVTPTVVNSNDFTATWSAATGASGYELDVFTDGPVNASELFFSEYVEGSSNNKYLEIFNGTGATVPDLSHYTVMTFNNGSSSPSGTDVLSGSLVDGAVLVLKNGSAPVYAGATTSAACGFNGNDAVLLLNNVTGDTLDIIGRIGENPGSAWTGTSGRTTLDGTLVRDPSVAHGVTSNPASGFPTLNTEWAPFGIDNVGGLGSHSFSATGEMLLSGYPVVLGNVTSYSVTGLDPLTTYNYRVRATGGACPPTSNSNTESVTTAAGSDPLLTAGTLDNFGARCLDVASEAHSFSLDGVNLTTADVTVGPMDGFTFATSEFGTYASSLTLTPSSGSIAETIWVVFTPTAELAYDGNIDIVGGGAPGISVAAEGSGINTAASVSSGAASAITLGEASVSGTIEDEGCSALTAYGIEYSTASFTPGTGTQVPSTNLAAGEFSSDLTGLDGCTQYWFVAFATNNGGTTYGTESSFTTDAVSAPVATTPTVINNTDFTATWNAVTGATGYRLDVSTDANFGLTSTTFSDGFNSGSAGLSAQGWTQNSIADYNSDGGVATPSLKFDANNDRLTSPTFAGAATNVSFWYKGQGTAGSTSTMLVEATANGTTWVTVGSLTNVPTNATGTVSIPLLASAGYVQFRFTYTKTTGNLAFDDAVITYVTGTPSLLPGYDNLAVAGTSQIVSGLTPGTDYYYQVRAESATCPLENSNTVEVTTTGGACVGNEVVLRINTDANANQISWEIKDEANVTVASGSPVGNNQTVDETLCLSNANGDCYTLKLTDSFGDGIIGGGWELRTTDGKTILKDDFAVGSVSPADPTSTATYGAGHPFCLPLGSATLKSTECGLFNNTLNNRIYGNTVPGATQYEFQFLDPDAGYERSIVKGSATMLFIQLGGSVNALVPGVKYFVRIRTDVDGPLSSAHYGPGCEMGLNAAAVVHCTQLINGTLYGHSCNEQRAFGSSASSFIYATPVLGASAYTFHIYIPGEPTALDTTITRSTYILQLKWPGTPMANGSSYNVDVKTTVNGVQSNYCTPYCQITINNGYTGTINALTQVDGSFGGDVQLWPNPVADGRVNLALNGLGDADQNIGITLYDVYGKQVFASAYGNSGSSFSTVLELPSALTSGVYLVHLTVNGITTVQRLSVVR